MRRVVSVALVLLVTSVASAAWIVCDPDQFPQGTVLNNAWPGVILSAHGDPGVLQNSDVLAWQSSENCTPPNVFGDTEAGNQDSWGDGNWDYLRADFLWGATGVRLCFKSNDSDGDQNAELLAFNSLDVEVDRDVVDFIPAYECRTLEVSATEIAYIKAYWDNVNRIENGVLDHLQYIPEPTTVFLLGLGGLALRRRRRAL